jgi:hypothetical protein
MWTCKLDPYTIELKGKVLYSIVLYGRHERSPTAMVDTHKIKHEFAILRAVEHLAIAHRDSRRITFVTSALRVAGLFASSTDSTSIVSSHSGGFRQERARLPGRNSVAASQPCLKSRISFPQIVQLSCKKHIFYDFCR